ncbi:MAG: DNA-methyltransferase [Pseudonocardiaceae bacterium]
MTSAYYSDGLITLYHGDCREVTEWLGADVLVTDPPYGIDHASNWDGPYKSEVIANDDSVTVRDEVLARWGSRPSLVFGSWKCATPPGTTTCLVWDKGDAAGMGDLSIPWKPNWELIYVQGGGFRGSRDSGVLKGNVVTWASKGRTHPNQKPTGLLVTLLAKCPRGVVADPFAGSGSTLVAAKQLGLPSIGVELEERFCEVTARRLDQGVLMFDGVGGFGTPRPGDRHRWGVAYAVAE